MGYFCPKNTFLQLKHIQKIYPTLLSTSSVKIHQMNYVTFHDTSHPSIFFSSNITHFLQKQPIKVKTFRLATARIKIYQIPHVIFGTKKQSFFRLFIALQCYGTSSSVLFYLNLYMLWAKGSDKSANFQTFDCSHESQPISVSFFKP